MKVKNLFLMLLIGTMSLTAFGQTNHSDELSSNKPRLLTTPADCEFILSLLDDGMNEADSKESKLIIILKMKNESNISLARTRLNNLRKYIWIRKFENSEIAVNPNSNETEQIELYVKGKLFYKFLIKAKDKLDLKGCVVGPDL